MAHTVFYSWQSDSPNRTNRNFIESALKKAIKELGKEKEDYQPAERPIKFDKDTKDVAGSPPIVDVIFEKIQECGVFVADLTFVGKTEDGRPIANPNVLIEYGWALSHVGHKRIICIMNTVFGEPSEQSMPFDIAHKRWPKQYSLEESATDEERSAAKQELATFFEEAISLALRSMETDEKPFIALLQTGSRKTCFLDDGELAGRRLPFGDAKRAQDIHWLGGKQKSLRVIPQFSSSKFRRSELDEFTKRQPIGFLDRSVPGSWDLLNDKGYLVFEAEGQNVQTEARNITQLTQWGEIWSIDAAVLSRTANSVPFPEISLSHALARFLRFMNTQLNLKCDVAIEAGYSGILGMASGLPPLNAGWEIKSYDRACGSAVEDEFVTRIEGFSIEPTDFQKLSVDSEQFAFPKFGEGQEKEEAYFRHAYTSMLPFFEDYWDVMGVDRFSFLPMLK